MTALLILLPILSVIGLLLHLLSALLRLARHFYGVDVLVAMSRDEVARVSKRVPVLEEKLRLLEKELADEKDHVECLLRQREGFIGMRRESEARVTELEADVVRLVKERDGLAARCAANLRVRDYVKPMPTLSPLCGMSDYVNPNPVPRPPCANCGSAAGCLCLVSTSGYAPVQHAVELAPINTHAGRHVAAARDPDERGREGQGLLRAQRRRGRDDPEQGARVDLPGGLVVPSGVPRTREASRHGRAARDQTASDRRLTPPAFSRYARLA